MHVYPPWGNDCGAPGFTRGFPNAWEIAKTMPFYNPSDCLGENLLPSAIHKTPKALPGGNFEESNKFSERAIPCPAHRVMLQKTNALCTTGVRPKDTHMFLYDTCMYHAGNCLPVSKITILPEPSPVPSATKSPDRSAQTDARRVFYALQTAFPCPCKKTMTSTKLSLHIGRYYSIQPKFNPSF